MALDTLVLFSNSDNYFLTKLSLCNYLEVGQKMDPTPAIRFESDPLLLKLATNGSIIQRQNLTQFVRVYGGRERTQRSR